jgi:hypothetical protein
MGWTTAETGFNSMQRQEIFLFSIIPRLALGPIQPPDQWVVGIVSPEIKQRVCEVAHSPPPIAKITNGGAIPPFPHVFMARDNFTTANQ